MATILHISNDFPDVLAPGKTKAFSSLIAAVPEHRHVVYSLNRVDGFCRIESLPSGEDIAAVAYGALPKGLFWHGRLKALAQWILADIREKRITPDVIHTHKLTVEGIIGRIVAQELGKPQICDILGDSDLLIYSRKPSLQPMYRQVLQEARVIFPSAPWTTDFFVEKAGLDRTKAPTLPLIPGVDRLRTASPVAEDRLLTIFHLDSWRRKNLEGMTEAIGKLAASRPTLSLDVFGAGSPKTLLAVRKMLREIPGHARVRLMGPVKHEQMQEMMRDYAGFVLPSKRETYGMVFVEALFNGLPVLFMKRWGIDGFFEAGDIGYACDPHSADDIARGMEHLLTRQAALKENIARMQQEGKLDILRRDAIVAGYRAGIEWALAAG